MKEVLKFLEKKKEEGDYYKYHLNGPATAEDLEELGCYIETVPDDYLTFLSSYNGGYICSGIMAEFIWECEGDGDYSAEESVREGSLNFLEVKEVINNVSYAEYLLQDIEEVEIPPESAFIIAETSGRSVILQKKKESPVFMLYSDLDDHKWKLKKIYNDFKTFFHNYVENDGYIKELS